ncbi:MAG: class I SAM-dependent methyltransferase [Polyangiaceae bacterium]
MSTLRLPAPATRPANLSLRSWLHGGPAPRAEQPASFSVLEVGSGGGENLLPLAFYDPSGRYVGVEPDGEQLEKARARASLAGVANLRFEGALELDDGAEFEVVLVRDGALRATATDLKALVERVSRHLAADGLLYLEGPVLPGAGVDALVGELVRATARDDTDDALRASVASLREVIARPSHPYPNLVALELAGAADLPSDELRRRASSSARLFFREIVELAGAAELRWICDAERDESAIVEALREELASRGASGVGLEQAIDILCYRRRRASIFCRADAPSAPRPGLDALDRLFIASSLTAVNDPPRLGPGLEEAFTSVDGARITSVDPLLKASLLALRASSPRPLSFAALMGAAVQRLRDSGAEGEPDDELVAGVARDLWALYARGLVDLHFAPGPEPTTGSTLHALARVEAAERATLTTPYHTLATLEGFDAALAKNLAALTDAGVGDDALVGAMMSSVLSGEIPLEIGGQRIADPTLLEPLVRALGKRGLATLERFGLIAPPR